MDYKILIFILICIAVLISGCTSLNSSLKNSPTSQANTNALLNLTSLDSMNMANTIPIHMDPGGKYDVTVTMKNTGSLP